MNGAWSLTDKKRRYSEAGKAGLVRVNQGASLARYRLEATIVFSALAWLKHNAIRGKCRSIQTRKHPSWANGERSGVGGNGGSVCSGVGGGEGVGAGIGVGGGVGGPGIGGVPGFWYQSQAWAGAR